MTADLGGLLLRTLVVAAAATAIAAPPAIVLGWYFARRSFPGKDVLSTLVLLPMVLPPTAVGILLLRLFAADGWFGALDLGIVLSLRGAVAASAVMAFPLIVRTARASFEALDPRLEAMSRTLGSGRLRTFLTVSLPLAGRGLTAGVLLGFARALGEFGATIMVAGNVPGRTQTLPSAIFAAQQSGDDARANVLMGAAVALGFVALLGSERLVRARGGERRA